MLQQRNIITYCPHQSRKDSRVLQGQDLVEIITAQSRAAQGRVRPSQSVGLDLRSAMLNVQHWQGGWCFFFKRVKSHRTHAVKPREYQALLENRFLQKHVRQKLTSDSSYVFPPFYSLRSLTACCLEAVMQRLSVYLQDSFAGFSSFQKKCHVWLDDKRKTTYSEKSPQGVCFSLSVSCLLSHPGTQRSSRQNHTENLWRQRVLSYEEMWLGHRCVYAFARGGLRGFVCC